jgi:hypothetical protein
MKGRRLPRFLLGALGAIAALAAFALLDWYPTLKDLGRLRRERSDLERRISDYGAAAAAFRFPDAGEEGLLAACEAELRRALPVAENDEAWTALAMIDMQALAGGARGPQSRFAAFLRPDLPPWDRRFLPWIERHPGAAVTGRSLWQGVVSGLEPGGYRLASRPVAMEMTAALPALLAFVNRASWGDMRLEVVRLVVETRLPLPRAWLDCRTTYWARTCSPRVVPAGAGGGEAGLQVDPDSPLLLQRVDPLFAAAVEKRELPPAGSPW